MVTLFDVARLAGVSTATVSRVVHGQDRVREATRIRVQQAIEELGYVPDGAAQSLSRRRKDVIGLVCVERQAQQYDIENMNLLFYDEVLRGVEARIRDHDWSLLITFLQGANDPGFPRIESFTGKVDGILIGEGIVPSPFIERLATRVPVVIFAGTPHEQAVDVVAADNLSGSAAVVTHLIRDHGKRRLFWVHGPTDSPDSRERRYGLDYVLRANPQCQLTGFYEGFYSVESGEKAGESPAGHAQARAAGCRRLRQRPDGHRRGQGAGQGRRPGAGGRGRGRLRRHLPRQPVRPPAHHRSPADAPAGRAGLRPAARAHRQPGAAPRHRATAHRAGAAIELRLPARHGHPPAGADAAGPASGAHRRGTLLFPVPSPQPGRRPARQAAKA